MVVGINPLAASLIDGPAAFVHTVQPSARAATGFEELDLHTQSL